MTSTPTLSLIRGVVAGTDEQLHSVRVSTQTGYGRVNKTPVLWIREANGKERRFEGALFAQARVGHDVAIIGRKGTNKPLAFANFTTDSVHEAKELTLDTSPNGTLISTLGLALVLTLPGLLPWVMITQLLGLENEAFTGRGLITYFVLLATCTYFGVNHYFKGHRERTSAVRDEIDRLLIEAQDLSGS